MRAFLMTAAAVLVTGTYVLAQVVDPDVRGPLRRGAAATGEALGAPGVENRIDRRQDRREVRRGGDPEAWRMRRYNDEWWYYSPQSTWMYYRDNRWTPYVTGRFAPLPPRYRTGYRGTYTSRYEPARVDRYAYGAAGAPMLTIAMHDNSFDPPSLNVAAGTTVTWVNNGAHEHTVTAADGSWDSGAIPPDGTYSARFKKPGTYQYVCDIHEGMKGTIQVGDAGQAPAPDAVEAAPTQPAQPQPAPEPAPQEPPPQP
jgi:plastocyanin